MRASVLMLSVDEAPMLERSLPAAMSQGVAEVVVIDNACTDATPQVIARHGARPLRLPERVSYAAAINVGLRHVDGDAVLLLNADCVPASPEFLGALVSALEDPRVGSVAPKLVRARAPREPGGSALESLDQLDAAGMFIDRRRKNGLVGFGAPAGAFPQRGAVFGADGAAALYRRRTLADCALPGGEVLDEDLALWASDADLAWRAQLLGWRCVYEPGARALHVRSYSPARRDQMPEWSRRLQFRNRLLMMAKNETPAGLRRDGAWILGYEVLALGHALLRERHLLGAYGEALRLLPGALRRRRVVQARRREREVPIGLRPPRD